MKVIFAFICSLLLAKGCSKEQVDFTDSAVEYSAMTRGYQLSVVARDASAYVMENTRGNKREMIHKYEESEKKQLVDLVSKLDLESIGKLTPPSKKHQFDGAPAANLKITYKGKTYETPTFDDGNPPAEIAEITELVKSFKNPVKE